MKKEDNVIAEIKKARKERAAAPLIEAWLFAKKLTATLFALAIIATGIAVIYWTNQNVASAVWSIAIYFCAACTLVNGFIALHTALMKVGK